MDLANLTLEELDAKIKDLQDGIAVFANITGQIRTKCGCPECEADESIPRHVTMVVDENILNYLQQLKAERKLRGEKK